MRRRRSIRLLKCASTTLALLLAVADGNLGRAQRSSILGGSSQPPKWAYVGNAGDPPRIAGGGEVSASQAGSQRPDVECATLSQPLQAIAALPIQDDSIFIRCATICASSSAGDVVILSTSALQTSCTCVFASAIASRVGLLDQSLCNARCGSTVNLPCGSTLSSTTVSIYSLPSLVAFLERNASGSNDQSGDDTMDRPTAAAPRRRRSGLGPGPITAIVLGVAALVGIVVLGIVKFAHIRKRGYGRGYGSGDFADSYVTERGRQLSSSASTKQNYSSTSMGTGAGLVGSQSTGANVDTKSDLQGLPEIGAANGKKIDNRNESYAMPGSAQAEAPKAEKKDMGLYSEINDMGFFEDSIADAIMKEGKLHEPVKNTEDKGNSLKQGREGRIFFFLKGILSRYL